MCLRTYYKPTRVHGLIFFTSEVTRAETFGDFLLIEALGSYDGSYSTGGGLLSAVFGADSFTAFSQGKTTRCTSNTVRWSLEKIIKKHGCFSPQNTVPSSMLRKTTDPLEPPAKLCEACCLNQVSSGCLGRKWAA